MSKLSFMLNTLMISLVLLFASSFANAQSIRTFVSGVGDDNNPCSRTAPCRTFSSALAKTAEHGEINPLDNGSYGAVTIQKSITIDGAGTLAAISANLINGIIVNDLNSGAPGTKVVILRNLYINGNNNGLSGILFSSGKTLLVENCRISGFRGNPGRGISASLSGNGNLKVVNTTIENVSGEGIRASTSAGQILVTIENSRLLNCDDDGFEGFDRVRAQIRNTIITHVETGVNTTGTDSIVNLDDVYVSYSLVGLSGGGSASEIRVSDSNIAQNATGLTGVVRSFQGNSLVGNNLNGTFTSTQDKQ